MWLLLLLLGQISFILAVFNLLPILPFDGGHAVVVLYEWIASKVKHRRVLRRLPQADPDQRGAHHPDPVPGAVVDGARHPSARSVAPPVPVDHQRRRRRVTRRIAGRWCRGRRRRAGHVQSMTTTKTADVDGTLAQIYSLAAAGCDIVRCTCNEEAAAEGLAQIVPRSPVPIIADIHFQYKLALAAMEAGRRTACGSTRATSASPSTSSSSPREAKDRGLPIRIGVNAGIARPRHRRAVRRRHARGAGRVGAA